MRFYYIVWLARRAVVSVLHPVIAFVSITLVRPLTRDWVYTVGHGLAKGMRVQGGLDFVPAALSPEERFLKGLDLRGKTVLDIGAHWGLFTLFFARACGPTGRVIAIEPHPDNAAHLSRNIALNQIENVSQFDVAISDTCGEAALFMPANESSTAALCSRVDAQQPGGEAGQTRTVRTETVDRMIANAIFSVPDLVKIDVEGAELAVLRGMEHTLSTAHPRLVIEVHDREDMNALGAAKAIANLLGHHGYELSVIETGEPVSAAASRAMLKRHIYGKHASDSDA